MKISIITATYNSADNIEQCITSLNQQTYIHYEHIIVDALSSDDTLDIIASIARQAPRIISEKDDGIYDALNKGIQHATGDIIGFLHSDDSYCHPHVLQEIVDAHTQYDIDASYADLIYTDKQTGETLRYWRAGNFKPYKIYFGWMPPHPTFYMHRKKYLQLKSFDASFRISGDYDAMLRYFHREKIRTHYIPSLHINMKAGGTSNRSLKNLLLKYREDYRALTNNNLCAPVVLPFKTLTKIGQLFNKYDSHN